MRHSRTLKAGLLEAFGRGSADVLPPVSIEHPQVRFKGVQGGPLSATEPFSVVIGHRFG